MIKPPLAQAAAFIAITFGAICSAQTAAQTPEQAREQYREACVAQVGATNPESSPRSKGKQVENCMDGMVLDARIATARAESATARAQSATARAQSAKADAEIATARAEIATARGRSAKADAEIATARAEIATARAIRQEMGKPTPDLAVLRAHLKTFEQDSTPNAETKGLTDALRDFIQLAAQRKAR
jgi:chromosome segregation ATPase